MCGIAGFYQTGFDYTRSEEYLHRLDHMKNSLLHRGPDNNDLFLSAHAGLAHTRLSIIDLAGGRQPMKKSFSYKTAIISYNGEIYNGKELKNYLRKYRITWNTSSDTEIILNGYLAEGTAFLAKLNGIFA